MIEAYSNVFADSVSNKFDSLISAGKVNSTVLLTLYTGLLICKITLPYHIQLVMMI